MFRCVLTSTPRYQWNVKQKASLSSLFCFFLLKNMTSKHRWKTAFRMNKMRFTICHRKQIEYIKTSCVTCVFTLLKDRDESPNNATKCWNIYDCVGKEVTIVMSQVWLMSSSTTFFSDSFLKDSTLEHCIFLIYKYSENKSITNARASISIIS